MVRVFVMNTVVTPNMVVKHATIVMDMVWFIGLKRKIGQLMI